MTDQQPGEAGSPPTRPTPPTAPTRPRRRRPGRRAEIVVRVALVLFLLGIAAQGLSGRRDLDWAALAEPPESAWIGLLLVGAAAFVLVASFRALLRMLRVTQESDEEAQPAIEGRGVTWLVYLAGAALVSVTLWLAYLLVKSAVVVPVTFHDPGQTNSVGGPSSASDGTSATDTWGLPIAVLVGAGLAIVLAVIRRPNDAEDAADVDDEATEPTALAEAVAAAEVELDSHGDDTRAAIIAAYLAMERQLMARGTTRQPSDTPTDFVLRAMAASHVSHHAATRLTELFREARFSTHPIAATARADAARALARVADDLAHDDAVGHDYVDKAGPRG